MGPRARDPGPRHLFSTSNASATTSAGTPDLQQYQGLGHEHQGLPAPSRSAAGAGANWPICAQAGRQHGGGTSLPACIRLAGLPAGRPPQLLQPPGGYSERMPSVTINTNRSSSFPGLRVSEIVPHTDIAAALALGCGGPQQKNRHAEPQNAGADSRSAHQDRRRAASSSWGEMTATSDLVRSLVSWTGWRVGP